MSVLVTWEIDESYRRGPNWEVRLKNGAFSTCAIRPSPFLTKGGVYTCIGLSNCLTSGLCAIGRMTWDCVKMFPTKGDNGGFSIYAKSGKESMVGLCRGLMDYSLDWLSYS